MQISLLQNTRNSQFSLPCLLTLLFSLSCLLFLFTGNVHSAVTVSTTSQLSNAINATQSGGDKTILIQPGTYNLNGTYLRIAADGVTVRGLGKTRGAVILDGNYKTTEVFQIVASNVTIQNLTIKHVYHHPIHVIGSDSRAISNTLIDNVHIIDPGQQAIKINPSGSKNYSVNNGVIKNSLIELTDTGRQKVVQINGSCYTGGIDAHFSKDWRIHDNHINGFWCASGLSEHGIHFWSNSSGTLVERNLITDCDRGIGFGLGSSGHNGGIIRNNMIYHGENHGYSDVGIGLESASKISVYNNTIFHEHPYPNGIEYRFSASKDNFIANNLTNKAIVSRDGGTATVSNNVKRAISTWFKDPSRGDLHLSREIPGVIDSGIAIDGLSDDFDKQPRSSGTQIDIGADEFNEVVAPTGLQVVTPSQFLLLHSEL